MVRLPPKVANYVTQTIRDNAQGALADLERILHPGGPLPRRPAPAVDAGRDRLVRQEEPDIDQLVPRVERAMWAYTICKERFDAVRETLGMYLQKDTAPTPPSR